MGDEKGEEKWQQLHTSATLVSCLADDIALALLFCQRRRCCSDFVGSVAKQLGCTSRPRPIGRWAGFRSSTITTSRELQPRAHAPFSSFFPPPRPDDGGRKKAEKKQRNTRHTREVSRTFGNIPAGWKLFGPGQGETELQRNGESERVLGWQGRAVESS